MRILLLSDFYLSDLENNIDFDYCVDFENIEEDLYSMCFDYVIKNKENCDLSVERFWYSLCPSFYRDDITLKPKSGFGLDRGPESINPSKSKSSSEKEVIRSIQSLGLEYFNPASLEIFRRYNHRDLEFYKKFKERADKSRSSS